MSGIEEGVWVEDKAREVVVEMAAMVAEMAKLAEMEEVTEQG